MAKRIIIEEKVEVPQYAKVDIDITEQVEKHAATVLEEERRAIEKRITTLDVDQAIVEIHRKRRKGNATAGIVNAILLEGLDNDALSREARAAIVSTDMLMPDERERVEAIRENRDSEQCTVLLAILDGIAPYVSESKK